MLSSALSLRLLLLLVLIECSLTEVTIFDLVSSFLASRVKLLLCEGTILHVGSSVGVTATSFLPRNEALISDALKEDRPGVPLAGAVCDFLVDECAQVSNCGPYGPKVRTASTGTRPLGLCDRPGHRERFHLNFIWRATSDTGSRDLHFFTWTQEAIIRGASECDSY
jgi:hypothetical protein